MNDGYYDIACVCVENPLDAKCEETYLRAYCGGEPSEEPGPGCSSTSSW